MDDLTTWRALFKIAGVSDTSALTITPKDLDLDQRFDPSWGGPDGVPFTAWSADRVYFPVTYDGKEWIGSVPRNPCDEATPHHGGY